MDGKTGRLGRRVLDAGPRRVAGGVSGDTEPRVRAILGPRGAVGSDRISQSQAPGRTAFPAKHPLAYNAPMLARLQGLTTEWLLPMAPGLLLLFTAGWAGTFQAPLFDRAPWLGFLALAAVAALAHGRWWDPLGLGRWAWCLPGIGLSLLISLWASPVPRAGRLAVAALPLIYLLPSAVRRCWNSEPGFTPT